MSKCECNDADLQTLWKIINVLLRGCATTGKLPPSFHFLCFVWLNWKFYVLYYKSEYVCTRVYVLYNIIFKMLDQVFLLLLLIIVSRVHGYVYIQPVFGQYFGFFSIHKERRDAVILLLRIQNQQQQQQLSESWAAFHQYSGYWKLWVFFEHLQAVYRLAPHVTSWLACVNIDFICFCLFFLFFSNTNTTCRTPARLISLNISRLLAFDVVFFVLLPPAVCVVLCCG